MTVLVLYLLLGIITGVLSGMLGIGGGIILVPTMLYIMKMTQLQAQGTTLALMVLPIGLLAAMTYYKAGYVNIKVSLLVALGFFIGGYFGSKLAVNIPVVLLRKLFGIALLITALYTIFKK